MIPGWKVSEMNAVRAWYGKTPIEHLAKQIRRTPEEVKAAAQVLVAVEPPKQKRRPLLSPKPRPEPKLRIVREPKPKPEPRLRRWTEDEVAVLIAMYPKISNSELALHFHCSLSHITQKAHMMGLQKDPNFLSDYARNRANTRRKMLIEALREAKDYLRCGDHLAALMRIDDAIGKIGGIV